MDQRAEKRILFVGTNLSHAVSNRIHDIVAKEVGINWQLEAMDTPIIWLLVAWNRVAESQHSWLGLAAQLARAAVYALSKALGASVIYIVNRDEHEVAALIRDAQQGYHMAGLEPPIIKHLRKPEDAVGLEGAYYGVGTVPDFEPRTETELDARAVFIEILNRQRGVFLDMCYRPRITRNLMLAQEREWTSGDGGQVVGWQLKAQWEVWAGKDVNDAIPLSKMVQQVHQIVESLANEK